MTFIYDKVSVNGTFILDEERKADFIYTPLTYSGTIIVDEFPKYITADTVNASNMYSLSISDGIYAGTYSENTLIRYDRGGKTLGSLDSTTMIDMDESKLELVTGPMEA